MALTLRLDMSLSAPLENNKGDNRATTNLELHSVHPGAGPGRSGTGPATAKGC